jgi:hypothetical protein
MANPTFMDSIADEELRNFERLSGDRGVWNAHWQEIAERMFPAYSNTFQTNNFRTPGEKLTDLIFDSTATVALKRFGAILDSLLTPRNTTWHRLLPSDPYLAKDRQTKLWFEDATRILFKHRYAPKANFASQNQQNYMGLGAFGTGCLFTDALKSERGLRYRAIGLGEIFFDENHQGIIDTAYRRFELTARQAVQQWGEDNLPKSIVDKAKDNTKFWFVHCVKPRADYDPQRLDAKGMPYASYYISEEGRTLIKEEGYTTFPYAIGRYEQAPGEVYGRGPAMDVLPAIKTLNEEKKTLLKQGHRALDPILLTHDDGIASGFSMKPGALNSGAVTQDGRLLVHALPTGNIAVGKDLMDDERAVINDAFLVTLFQILVETPTMTATEVMERTREKGILLAPTVGRQQSEYLGPLIEREIDVMVRQGLLPPMPPALLEAQGEYRVEYDSPLSRAQRAEEVAGVMRTVETALNIVNVTQDPSPLDHFDWDAIIPEVAEIQAVPTRWMRAADQVKALRDGRQQAQQQQQTVNALPGVAAMTKAAAVAREKQQ